VSDPPQLSEQALLHADPDLLVVHKPAGVGTHRGDPWGQDGFYEWACGATGERLSLLHRLDKDTSGVLLLGRSERANQSVTQQLEQRDVRKRYLLVTASGSRGPTRRSCDEAILGKGKKGRAREQPAHTDFERVAEGEGYELWEARPHTGRRHQVRVHATRLGLPILGDRLYDGPPSARLFLHAAGVELARPDGQGPLKVEAPLPASFELALTAIGPTHARLRVLAALEARGVVVDPAHSDCFVALDREHDGFPDLRVERLGEVALVHRYEGQGLLPRGLVRALLETEAGGWSAPRAVVVRRRVRGEGDAPGAPEVAGGDLEAPRFVVREHGLRFLIDLEASRTSTGLFLDQRETRRSLLAEDLTGSTVLNAFAHTGSLSVAAARAGAETLTLDLSQRYLDWARENMRLNEIEPGEHDFIYGDALDWMRRLERKGRRFDRVLVDPPSASTTGKGKRWTVERDLGLLVERAARLVAPEGRLFVSCNLHRLRPERFARLVADGLAAAGRKGATLQPRSLPLDHRCGPQDPPYLKAAWVQL
jgi:23S rRNA (cytosine1962-C5)-methyltransferase